MQRLITKKKKSLFQKLAILLTFIFTILSITASILIDNHTKEILQYSLDIKSLKILDREGILIQEIGEGDNQGEAIPLEDISKYFLNSIIVVEDKNYNDNSGVDIKRTLKCTAGRILSTEICGGSTITQQYVEMLSSNSNSEASQNVKEKLLEIATAININRYLSKEQIISRYINNLYFANNRYGIEDASQGYFGIPASQLNLTQSSFLAAIPNSPTYYNPYENYENTKSRQETILKLLFEAEYITKAEYEFAKTVEIELSDNLTETNAPHFVELISTDIQQAKKLKTGELSTTMSLELYKKTLDIVSKSLSSLEGRSVTNAAVVILDAETGEILTLVGSADYWSDQSGSQVNHATTLRQPGSTFKPFIYALGIQNGLTANTKIKDEERVFLFAGNSYEPTNYDKKYHGDVTVRTALSNSLNIPAVAVQEYIGTETSYNFFDSINMPSIRQQDSRLATALGGFSISLLDLTNAYRIFPNDGIYLGYPVLLKSEIAQETKLKVFGEQSDGVAYVITDILSDTDARRYLFGSFTDLNLPFKASVKTGTSQNYRDSLTIGYTGEFVVGVWVGNSDNSSMDGIAGLDGAASIWNDVMKVTYDYYNQSICTDSCDFLITNPLYLNDTNTFTPAQEKVLGPI